MAVVVGQAAVVEHLQQDVEHVAVGLFDFVEQHDGVRPAADGFGEPAPFFVADVARRGADQAADGVPLHELAHVEADHRVLVVEQHLRQRLAKLGFAHAGGAEEDERADRAVRVLQAAAAAADGVGDGLDRFVLADDALVQPLFEHQQLGLLGLHHSVTGMPVQALTTSAISSGPTSRRSRRGRLLVPSPLAVFSACSSRSRSPRSSLSSSNFR